MCVCVCVGAKLDDFADFTTFGIATSLLLTTESLLDNLLCMCYVLSVFTRLCFFSSGKQPGNAGMRVSVCVVSAF